MTTRDFLIADVFTGSPLEGNQLGIFTDGRGLDDDLMLKATRELNFSETVFFLRPEPKPDDRPDDQAKADVYIRIFTPGGENDQKTWIVRMFAPALGVTEDPATGSAAGPLAVHLARHGRIAFGEEIEIRQGDYIHRPSVLYASSYGSQDELEKVVVGGRAVVVARGEYRLRLSGERRWRQADREENPAWRSACTAWCHAARASRCR